MMRAHPHLLQGLNLWWIRFFVLAVYATMFVRDHTRPLMHEAMGLDSTQYDYEVFRITSEISAQVFPIDVDIDHPVFRACMSRLVEIAVADAKAKQQGGLWGTVKTRLVCHSGSGHFHPSLFCASQASGIAARHARATHLVNPFGDVDG